MAHRYGVIWPMCHACQISLLIRVKIIELPFEILCKERGWKSMVLEYLKILLVFKGRRWHGIGKKEQNSASSGHLTSLPFNLILSLQHTKVQSLQPQIQRVLCANSKLFWPHSGCCLCAGWRNYTAEHWTRSTPSFTQWNMKHRLGIHIHIVSLIYFNFVYICRRYV